ncbi:MAG: large subunit ribosomal protein L3 [Parcubacteria group bacterium Gr01-1014_44]|nr:MAG: large subunit ribosomal protein L3 [Parcubacteria group bacterium Gr01-1014_44]
MSQIFEEDGTVIPVTVVSVEPMKVTQTKTADKDGYEAIQFGSGSKKKLTKPIQGQLKELGKLRHLKEARGQAEWKTGDTVDVSVFNPGDKVKVSGVSKGKGFQGAVKRHGFHGMPASHGHKHVKRHVGSIGQRFPQHTLKGMRMAGRMGGERVTTRGLKIIKVDKDNNLLAIKGAVPGRKGTLLEIRGI